MAKSKKSESHDIEERTPGNVETPKVAKAPKTNIATVPDSAALLKDYNAALDGLRTKANQLEQSVRANPMAAIAIAAAFGLSIGLLVNPRQH